MTCILHIDSSAQSEASIIRRLGAELVERLGAEEGIYRDLTKDTLDFIGVDATFPRPEKRDQATKDSLANPNKLVDMTVGILVIGVLMYNLGISCCLQGLD